MVMEGVMHWLVGATLLVLSLDLPSAATGQWCAPKLFESKKWTLTLAYTDHGFQELERTSTLSMDLIGQRLAAHETGTRNGQRYSVFKLYYYPAGSLFTVEGGECRVTPLSGNLTSFCWSWDQSGKIIDYFEKEYIGTPTDGTPFGGGIVEKHGINSLLSFSMDAFIPLFVGQNGVIDNVPTFTVGSYFNLTQGIKDPSVFTPPESCIKSQELSSSATLFNV